MKRVMVLSTGGTIASVPGHDGRNIAGAQSGQALLSKVEVGADIKIGVESVFQKASNSLTAQDLLLLRDKCQGLIDTDQVDGIVITHGTDTLEDTAYFLECSLNLKDKVVVVTGSQRVPYAAGTDAFVNIQDSITVAASPNAVGLGVVVQFNQTIFAAAFVRKTSTYQLNGFSAPGFGCLGLVDGDNVLIYQQPKQQPLLAVKADNLPQVELITVSVDSSNIALKAIVDSDVAGIVIDAIGRGQVLPCWVTEIKRAITGGKKVLVCSSALTGPVAPCYEYPAALHEIEQLGAIGIAGLPARKARIRLRLVLAEYGLECSREQIIGAYSWGVKRTV